MHIVGHSIRVLEALAGDERLWEIRVQVRGFTSERVPGVASLFGVLEALMESAKAAVRDSLAKFGILT